MTAGRARAPMFPQGPTPNVRPIVRLNRPSPLLNFGDFFVLAIGLACSAGFSLVGSIPYAEVLTPPALLYLLWKDPKLPSRPVVRTVLILLGLWLASQMFSDVWNGSIVSSRLKGIARIVFFAVDFLVFSAMLSKNTKRIALVAIALAVSDLVRLPAFGGFNATGWKFGGSLAVSILVMLLGSWFSLHRRYGAFVLLVLALALLNLHYGYRSQVAVDLVTVVFTLPIFPRPSPRKNPAASDRIRAAVLLFCSAGALWTAQKAIHEAAKFGAFEESVEAKFEQQSNGKLGVLIGARPEIPVSLRAIADAPLLGHGSYATDPKYAIMLQEYQYRYGYSESDEPNEESGEGIPTHSHLTGAWVDGGALASLLWLYLLVQIVRAAVVISSKRPALSPLYAFLFITFFWDILFSPFGYDRRIYESFFIVLLVDLTAKPASKHVGRLRNYYARRVYSPIPSNFPASRLIGSRSNGQRPL